ncbi:MAG: M23 family metallopeptidase [Desulfovibrionaceae bacterium]
MVFSRYQTIIFTGQGELLASFRLGGWLFLLLPLVLTALGVGNVVLLQRLGHLREEQHIHQQLEQTREDLSRLVALQSAQLANVEYNLGRIMEFDAKLRIMLGMGDATDMATAMAGPFAREQGLSTLPVLFRRDHTRRMRSRIHVLSGDVLEEEVRQQGIAHAIAAQLETLSTIPVIMPTKGRFSSGFGPRNDPFAANRRFHKGIDLTAPTGTPVRATANGLVVQTARSPSYGLVIVIMHSAEIKTRYAHLSKFAVEEGQRVLRGQIIGYVGNTGRSKAPHLHYEVHHLDRPVNPRNYILQ